MPQVYKKTVLAAIAGAAVSDEFDVVKDQPVTVTLGAALGLVSGDLATLQNRFDNDNFADVATTNDGTIQLSDTNTTFTIVGVGTYRVSKGVTANPASILISY